MKKANLFFLITMIVIGCVLSGCAGNDNAEIVKESSKLQEINLTLYNGKSVNVTELEKVEDIVKVINGAASTKKESVQDVPDAKQYGKIILVSKEDERTLYYYEREGKYYIEEPYVGIYGVGIYQCDQDLNLYFKSIADL